MPKISSYPDGGAIQDADQFVIARSGQNKSILGSVFSGGKMVFITPVRMVDSLGTTWQAYAAAVGTYNFDLQDANHNLPAGITGVIISLVGRWTTSNTSFTCTVADKGGSGIFAIRALVANVFSDNQGISPVGTDDDVSIIVAGGNMSAVTATLIGYIT